MNFDQLTFDHVGIRVTVLEAAEQFYAKFSFIRIPDRNILVFNELLK